MIASVSLGQQFVLANIVQTIVLAPAVSPKSHGTRQTIGS
jgi:hypothetical protein